MIRRAVRVFVSACAVLTCAIAATPAIVHLVHARRVHAILVILTCPFGLVLTGLAVGAIAADWWRTEAPKK